MFNDACNRAYPELRAKLPAGSNIKNLMSGFVVPFFEFDADKYKVVLNIDSGFAAAASPAGEIYFNTG